MDKKPKSFYNNLHKASLFYAVSVLFFVGVAASVVSFFINKNINRYLVIVLVSVSAIMLIIIPLLLCRGALARIHVPNSGIKHKNLGKLVASITWDEIVTVHDIAYASVDNISDVLVGGWRRKFVVAYFAPNDFVNKRTLSVIMTQKSKQILLDFNTNKAIVPQLENLRYTRPVVADVIVVKGAGHVIDRSQIIKNSFKQGDFED